MSRAAEIRENLERVRAEIPKDVTLIVVTKTYPISDIEILYEAGVRDFGENRDHEGSAKAPLIPKDANWHFQGQIQSNKLKSIVEWADYIHSLDDLDHAKKINKLRKEVIPVFIQVSLDGQIGRGGILPAEIPNFLDECEKLKAVNPIGLMAVAPLGESPDVAFSRLAGIKSDISAQFPEIKYLSAGMSGDYQSAISHGATHIRVGSSILGSRV
jgi:pyridoxal phosphate enzyme (YggS family)